MNIYLRLKWNDPRLKFSHLNKTRKYALSHKQIEKVWIPDVFIKNEKYGRTHDIVVPNRLLHLYPNGNITYSQRLSLTLHCELQLKKFPMDNQTCRIVIGSCKIFYFYFVIVI